MRKPERLDSFYDELKEIHKKSFPDMRFGQFMMNVLGWINSIKKRDPFFPEEDEMLNLIKEYANDNSMWYQGWELLNKKQIFSGVVVEEKMWCANNGCYHYDKENDECTRIGKDGSEGVCWMNKSEGKY